MSFSGDLLTATTPTRLSCEGGTWVLELVRFVVIDRDVFQPKTQRIEGGDAILQHLKRGEHAQLVGATQQLLRTQPPQEAISFEAADGDWVPGAPEVLLSVRPSAGSPSEGGELWELRAELMVLMASHERLRERVVRLENQIHVGAEQRRTALSAQALLIPKLEQASRIESFASALSQGGRGGEGAKADAPVATPALEPAPVSVPRPDARIKFPPVKDINTCLRALLGDKVTVKEKKPATFAPSEDDAYWMSPLIDDEGVEAGAIVADVTATTMLGGILMMLPDHEVNAQRTSRTPSADTIDAMSEVSNNLSAAFNQLPGAIRLRVKPIEPVKPGSLDWVTPLSHKMQLEVLSGMGFLWLISR